MRGGRERCSNPAQAELSMLEAQVSHPSWTWSRFSAVRESPVQSSCHAISELEMIWILSQTTKPRIWQRSLHQEASAAISNGNSSAPSPPPVPAGISAPSIPSILGSRGGTGSPGRDGKRETALGCQGEPWKEGGQGLEEDGGRKGWRNSPTPEHCVTVAVPTSLSWRKDCWN